MPTSWSLGVGVRPATAMAEQAGLALDRGIAVNEYLETSAPGIFAAGDVARWPDPHHRRANPRRALGRGRASGPGAARNMLGRREPFDAVPFFWSQHYDVTIKYVGHARTLGCGIAIDGSLDARDCVVTSCAPAGRSPWRRSRAIAKVSRPRSCSNRRRLRRNRRTHG